MITTKWIVNGQDLSDPYYIREKVFIEEQNVPEFIEKDDLDKTAHHVVVYNNDKPVATGRLIITKKQQYILGRIAVLKEHRGQHFGDLVVRMLVRRAFDMGAKEIHIHAQTKVQRFYEKLGFTPYGQIYQEAGIDHINMVRTEDIQNHCGNCPNR